MRILITMWRRLSHHYAVPLLYHLRLHSIKHVPNSDLVIPRTFTSGRFGDPNSFGTLKSPVEYDIEQEMEESSRNNNGISRRFNMDKQNTFGVQGNMKEESTEISYNTTDTPVIHQPKVYIGHRGTAVINDGKISDRARRQHQQRHMKAEVIEQYAEDLGTEQSDPYHRRLANRAVPSMHDSTGNTRLLTINHETHVGSSVTSIPLNLQTQSGEISRTTHQSYSDTLDSSSPHLSAPISSSQYIPQDDTSALLSQIDWDEVEDDPDDVEKEHIKQLIAETPKLYKNANGFGRHMKKLINKGKLKEAIELFEHQMLKVDRIQPTSYTYNVLIAGCGQAGATWKAFRLYNDMKKRALKPKHVTYTSLLNACANGHNRTFSLKKLGRLREIMLEKRHQMNVINYHALIKAYGRCGELQQAFTAADELVQQGHPLTTELATFLMQACIADKQQGFRHALLVWHQLRQKRISPDIYLYNLMLRCALECHAGDAAIFDQAIDAIVCGAAIDGAAVSDGGSTRVAIPAPAAKEKATRATRRSADASSHSPSSYTDAAKTEETQQNGSGSTASTQSPGLQLEISQTSQSPPSKQEQRMAACLDKSGALAVYSQTQSALPDLLAKNPTRGALVQLNHVDYPENRLGLLGGWVGLLKTMASDAVAPDIKTFSILLKTMPHDIQQEESLLRTMDVVGVKPDVGFFNQLIKKRCARLRNTGTVEALLAEMKERHVQPDVATYGCISMSVRTCRQAEQLLQKLDQDDIRPNVEILTTLLNQSTRVIDPYLALMVMQAFVKYKVLPDRRALARLEELRLNLRKISINKERGLTVPPAATGAKFSEGARKFQLRYPRWLAEVEAEAEVHPMHQYKVAPFAEKAREAARQRAERERDEKEEAMR